MWMGKKEVGGVTKEQAPFIQLLCALNLCKDFSFLCFLSYLMLNLAFLIFLAIFEYAVNNYHQIYTFISYFLLNNAIAMI